MKKLITLIVAVVLLFTMCSCVCIPNRVAIQPLPPVPAPVVVYEPYYPVPIFWTWEFGIGWRGHRGPPYRHR